MAPLVGDLGLDAGNGPAVANQPTVSSKSRVNHDRCRAHGTWAATTPCLGQRTRVISASRYTGILPKSRPRHRRGPCDEPENGTVTRSGRGLLTDQGQTLLGRAWVEDHRIVEAEL